MTITKHVYAYFENSTTKIGQTGLGDVAFYIKSVKHSDSQLAVVLNGTVGFEVGYGVYGVQVADMDLEMYDYVGAAQTASTAVTSKAVPMLRWDAAESHDAELAKLTALPTDPADQSLLEAAIATLAIANAAAIVNSGVTGSTIEIYNYATAIIELNGLPDITGWDKLWFTGKNKKSDEDSEALFHLALTAAGDANDGLQYLNGAAATKTDGVIEVLTSTSIKVTIKASAMASLAAITGAFYGIKKQVGTDYIPVSEGGTLNIKDVTPKAIA